MTTRHAVAEFWSDGSFTLTVVRDVDDHEDWGDQVAAARPEDMPAAAAARLVSTRYRVAGEWVREDKPLVGPSYRALVVLVSP